MAAASNAPPVAPAIWSKPAIASAVFGLIGLATLWLVFGLLVAGIAAVLGHVARHETRARGLRGRRLATFGLGLGYGAMLLFPILALLVGISFPALEKWRAERSAESFAESRANASRLFVACEAYARANRDRYPAEWEQLSGRYLPSDELASLLESPHPGGVKIAFELVRHDRPVLEAIADSVVVIQEVAPPDVPHITVVHANGRTASLHNPDYEKP